MNEHIGLTKEEFVKKYNALVHSICKKYIHLLPAHVMEYDDLVSVGMIGLIKAYGNYDPGKVEGVIASPMTYSYIAIQGEVLRYLRDDNPGGVKFGRSTKEIAREIFKQELDLDNPNEISQVLNVPIEKVHLTIQYLKHQKRISMDDISFENDGDPLTLSDQYGTEDDCTQAFVHEFIQWLPPTLGKVIQLRMRGMLQREIAEVIGTNQVQVSRYLKQLIEKYQTFVEEAV